MSEASKTAQSELGTIVRTLVTEGGHAFEMLLMAAISSPIIAFVLGMILTDIAEKKFGWITADVGIGIKLGLGAMVGGEVAGEILAGLPFKSGGTPPKLTPDTVVVNPPARLPQVPLGPAPETIPHRMFMPEELERVKTEQQRLVETVQGLAADLRTRAKS